MAIPASDSGRSAVRAVYAIFALSGIAGLVYQVVWVRWFGRLFGNTVYSMSLVVAVFMCGLGLGSYLAGHYIDRRHARRPNLALRAYAGAELAIAALGAGLSYLLPALEPLAARISSYSQDPVGWHELSAWSFASRLAIAVVLLAPITTLMGATLTLLIRHVLHRGIDLAGWRIGLLYGFNTAGAAAGALLSDFTLIPSFGLRATQMIAVLLNLSAALLALRLGAKRRVEAAPDPPELLPGPTAPAAAVTDASATVVRATSIAIFCSGFFAMGVEVLWFRHFTIELGSYRAVFSLLLFVILVGLWLGSLLGGYCERRLGRPALWFLVTQTALAASAMILLATGSVTPGHDSQSAAEYLTSLRVHVAVTARLLAPMVAVVGLPALLMGFSYPLANANIQRADRRVGRRAGLLYLANTLGGVLGSLCAGFLLLPGLGMRWSLAVLAGVAAITVIAIQWARGEPDRHRAGWLLPAGCLVALVASVVVWLRVPEQRFYRHGVGRGARVLSVSDGVYETIAVTEQDTPHGPSRTLMTNGHSMSGTDIFAQRYMRAFVHIPLLHLERPTDVLVICFGVGTTIHAASLHRSVERLEVVDLSRHVLEQADYFRGSNRGVLADPRLQVFINDGRQHLWMQPPGRYDLITLEPPPIAQAGVSALYSREFYRLARSRLRRGGFLSQWLPGYQLPEAVVLAMVRAFVDVFPNAILLSGQNRQLILVGSNRPSRFTLDPDTVLARLEAEPEVRADLERVYLGTPTEILGTFLASSATLIAATRGVEPVTDDYPIMEYAAPPETCWRTRFPAELVDLRGLPDWCPRCFGPDGPAPAVAALGDYLRILGFHYRGRHFLEFDSCAADRNQAVLPVSPSSPAWLHTSYLRALAGETDAGIAPATE